MDVAELIPVELIPSLVAVVVISPFMYVGQYLLHKDFYNNSKPVLRWSFAFCLSLIWYIQCTLIAMIQTDIHPIENLTKSYIAFMASLLSVFSLSVAIYYGYLRKKNFSYIIQLGMMLLMCVVAIQGCVLLCRKFFL